MYGYLPRQNISRFDGIRWSNRSRIAKEDFSRWIFKELYLWPAKNCRQSSPGPPSFEISLILTGFFAAKIFIARRNWPDQFHYSPNWGIAASQATKVCNTFGNWNLPNWELLSSFEQYLLADLATDFTWLKIHRRSILLEEQSSLNRLIRRVYKLGTVVENFLELSAIYS